LANDLFKERSKTNSSLFKKTMNLQKVKNINLIMKVWMSISFDNTSKIVCLSEKASILMFYTSIGVSHHMHRFWVSKRWYFEIRPKLHKMPTNSSKKTVRIHEIFVFRLKFHWNLQYNCLWLFKSCDLHLK